MKEMKNKTSRTIWEIRNLERLIRLFFLLLSGLKLLFVFDGSTERAHRGIRKNSFPGFVPGPLGGGQGSEERTRRGEREMGKGWANGVRLSKSHLPHG